MERSLFADAEEWAQAQFGAVDLGRGDRNQRLVFSAARLAEHPGASFPAVFNRRDLRCFYALMHRKECSHAALLSAHCARTQQAMNTPDVILVVHDTTQMDFTSHQALHDQVGPIGKGDAAACCNTTAWPSGLGTGCCWAWRTSSWSRASPPRRVRRAPSASTPGAGVFVRTRTAVRQ